MLLRKFADCFTSLIRQHYMHPCTLNSNYMKSILIIINFHIVGNQKFGWENASFLAQHTFKSLVL
ncbi:hypothetical protein JF50_19195 [Pseudoalteromonas luteoviolacea]|uniref:Uncharacterized protein n=1 Tax=Pseudoalteromonas luteoviolacea TaxID=43657 RepID=A0A0C1QA97_9GAMM|nr:hypothetical protein JF50_14585 [Pseudoalteromonas luteoviolacea]KID56355.1 hypothetical protein JF50_19195 [Pseudoalteromonas luteoviolacea]